MFNFDDEDEGGEEYNSVREQMKTSHGRFWYRIDTWKKAEGSVVGHHFWWLVHNCIAHPMIGLFPTEKTFKFHDYTSDRINHK